MISALYAEVMVICLVLICIMFTDNLNHKTIKLSSPLSKVYVFIFMITLSELIWYFVDGRPNVIIINHIVNIIYLSCFGFMGYEWLMHCISILPYKKMNSSSLARLFIISPAVIVMIIVFMSARTGWVYSIDYLGRYHRGVLHFLQYTVGFVYVIASSIIALIACDKSKIYYEREYYKSIALFIMWPLIGCVIQNILGPFFPVGSASMILPLCIIFNKAKDIQITIDKLTNLPNRQRLDIVLEDKIDKYHDGEDLYLIIADIDSFKKINDTYGHIEGDYALKKVASILYDVCGRHNVFVSRMGGDEFVIIIDGWNFTMIEAICIEIGAYLKAVRNDKQYDLSLSTGYAKYDGKTTAVEFIDQADKQLYINKVRNKKTALKKSGEI